MQEMKKQIATLRRLQELVLTRDEHYQTGDGSRLDDLNDSIDELKRKLEPQTAGMYERLYKKNHIVMAAMSNGCCAACGMQVPIAQGQQVKLAQHLVTCSSCGRILFAADEDAARNVAEKGDRDDAKTGVARFSAASLMIPDLGPCTREEAISRLSAAMESAGYVSNADSLTTAALEREAMLSTALGEGLAFPHVRGVEGGSLTLAMGVSKDGIDWDGTKVHIVFLSAIPVAVSAFYLRMMAGLAQSFNKPANREAAFAAEDAAALWKALVKATRTTVK